MTQRDLVEAMLANMESWAASHKALIAGRGRTNDALAFARWLRSVAEREWLTDPTPPSEEVAAAV